MGGTVLQTVTVDVAVAGVPVDVTTAVFGRSMQPVWLVGTTKVADVGKVVVCVTTPSVTGVPPLKLSVTVAESPLTDGLPALPSLKVNCADVFCVIVPPPGDCQLTVAVFVWATL